MAKKSNLTAAQRQEWKKWAAGMREIDHHLEADELEYFRDLHFFAPPEYLAYGVNSTDLLFVLMVHPCLTDDVAWRLVEDQRVQDRGSNLARFPKYCEIMHRHGVDVLPGRTGWVVELLTRGVTDWPRFYMHFYSGDLFAGLSTWLLNGGYHQTPMIEVFPYATTAYHRAVEREKWEEKWLNRYWEYVDPIFKFRDTENLAPQESPYYAFAAYAQDYLCHQIDMPKPLAEALTAKLGIKSLAEFECLPLLPRPVYEIPAPVAPEVAVKKRKSKATEEVYDEFYEFEIDAKFPYPTPRFYAKADIDAEALMNEIIAEFKRLGYLTRAPKTKIADVSDLLSASYLSTKKKKWPAHFVAFKAHPRFAMSDEFDVWVRVAISTEPLSIANGVFNDATASVDVAEDTCNVAIDIAAPDGQKLDEDTSAIEHLRAVVKSLAKSLGIKFNESKPPEILDSWEV